MQESCGVFGVYAPGISIAHTIFFALFALQHRGQESAGIAVSDGDRIRIHTSMGLVSQAFTENDLLCSKDILVLGTTATPPQAQAGL